MNREVPALSEVGSKEAESVLLRGRLHFQEKGKIQIVYAGL